MRMLTYYAYAMSYVQRARKLVETRLLNPYQPTLTHVEQLASIVGMTARQVLFAANFRLC